MPRKQTKNLSNVGGITYAPATPVDHRKVVDGCECITVSLEFVGQSEAQFRCRIGRWWGPWRINRGEAMRDLHDAVRTRIHGQPWTRGGDYEVMPVSFGMAVTDVLPGKPNGPSGGGGAR